MSRLADTPDRDESLIAFEEFDFDEALPVEAPPKPQTPVEVPLGSPVPQEVVSRPFPRSLWFGAVPLGLISAVSIFLFIGWLQPTLGGGERITLPAIVQFKVAQAEPPPPPPAQEEQKEKPKKEVRKRPIKQRAPMRTQRDLRPQVMSAAGVQSILPGDGPRIDLSLETDVDIDTSSASDRDVLDRRRRMVNREIARTMSRRGGREAKEALSRFTEPRGIDQYEPEYPEEAKAEGIEGSVVVNVLITMVGSVEEIEIVSAKPPGYFEASVEEAVSQWVFVPAKDEMGNPVDFWKKFRLVFRLENAR